VSAGLASFLLLQPAKTLLRVAVDQQPSVRGPLWRLEELGLITSDLVLGKVSLPQGLLDLAAGRLNFTSMFACVVEQTPETIPYWKGQTYYPFLLKLAPRLLFPNKPLEDAGQAFPHRYGMIVSGDTTTSVNLPQIIEGFVNFGWPGVLIEMVLIGGLYRFVQMMLIRPTMSIGEIIVVGYIVSWWANIENNASMVFGALPFQLLYAALVGLLVSLAARGSRGH